jgi:cytochrome c oxidase subunit IV
MIEKQFLFGKKNYMLMAIGIALIILGYLLMSGGASKTVDTFNYDMFSTMRIRIAPMVVIAGFIVEIWAILAKPNK